MSEETPAILTDPLINPSSDPSAPKLALGAALRTARKRLDLSIEDAAHQLRMSSRQVLALEEDNLAALTTPAFVRGFIRNYARLLKLDPEPLLQAYRAMLPSDGQHSSISLQSEHIAISDGSRKTWLLYVLASFLVVVLGSGWLLYKDWSAQQTKKVVVAEPVPANESPVVVQPAPEPVIPQQTASAQPVEMPPASVAAVQPAEPAPAKVPPAAVPVPVPASPVASLLPSPPAVATDKPVIAKGPIRMVFSEQTWVSVVDSTGKEVFNKNKAAGTEDAADGVPPFSVVIGNANGVKVFYQDKPYDIAPYTKSNVARLKLE